MRLTEHTVFRIVYYPYQEDTALFLLPSPEANRQGSGFTSRSVFGLYRSPRPGGNPLESTAITPLVFRFLRAEGVLADMTPSDMDVPLIAVVSCNDDRIFWEETDHTRTLHGREIIPFTILGGGVRYSSHCPTPSDMAGSDQLLAELRTGLHLRPYGLVKNSCHGPECGMCNHILQLGVAQRIWLTTDGRNTIKRAAVQEGWSCPTGELGVFPSYHRRIPIGGGFRHRSYRIRHHHDLIKQIPLEVVLRLSDQDFLERYAPDFLRAHEQLRNLALRLRRAAGTFAVRR